MTDSARDNLTDSKDLEHSTPQVLAVRDFTADDLDPAYGSHGSNPHGVNYSSEEREHRWHTFLSAVLDGHSIRKALKLAGLSWGTVSRWMAVGAGEITGEERTAQYERAREQAAETWADRAVAAAYKPQTTMVGVQQQRLKADVAKWRAAVQSPRRWSERQDTNIAVQVNVSTNQVMMDQLRRRNLSDG